jgi:hypothetical protein
MNLQEQFVQFYEQSGYTQPQLARANRGIEREREYVCERQI